MNQKQILIIAVICILAVIACLTCYMLVNSQPESLTTLRISESCTVQVPQDNSSVENLEGSMKRYSFNTTGLNITHEKNANNTEIKELNSKQIKNSEKVEGNIYYDSSTGIYSAFIENTSTGDALLITSKDLDLLKRVQASVKFKSPKSVESTNDTNITPDEEYMSFDENYTYDESYYPQDNTPYSPPSPSDGGSDDKPQQDNSTN